MAANRRTFLRTTGALGAALASAKLNSLFVHNAFAEPRADYRALVCVFLYGGNDANNMVIPHDQYADYAAVRQAAAFAVTKDKLLPISPPSAGAQFGLHTNLTEMHALFNTGKLAILCNAGTLVRPITKAEYQARTAPLPLNLFSHQDQQYEYQAATGVPKGTGWAGRVADRLAGTNGGNPLPMVVSVGGAPLFAVGATTRPVELVPGVTFGPRGQSGTPASTARLGALQRMLKLESPSTLARRHDQITADAFTQSALIKDTLAASTTWTTPFPNTTLGNQLKHVAAILNARDSLKMHRQIFFCSLGGFDTHTDQLTNQGNLFRQLSQALHAFYQSTIQMGIEGEVTTFTMSDFARTFLPAGTTGTDHGWGSHHLILGGSVQGGDFYGTYPTLALKGPDDVSTVGRWLPTVSTTEYAATLAAWYGVGAGDLPLVFPDLAKFARPDLGFMKT